MSELPCRGIKRPFESHDVPRYRDVTCDIVNVTKVMTMTPYILRRDDFDGDWRLQVLVMSTECIMQLVPPLVPNSSSQVVHRAIVRFPANDAAKQELTEHYSGHCLRYLGSSRECISAWSLSIIAGRLGFTI